MKNRVLVIVRAVPPPVSADFRVRAQSLAVVESHLSGSRIRVAAHLGDAGSVVVAQIGPPRKERRPE